MKKHLLDEAIIESIDELESFLMKNRKIFVKSSAIALVGEMGLGKTSLVRTFLKLKGYDDPVTSPTFPIQLEYELDDFKVIHIDAFRLESSRAEDFDFASWAEALVFVEWPERLALNRPQFDYQIEISWAEEKRKFQIFKLQDDLSNRSS
ncbi:MAG: tRNA (adenosine(37)-N6)-threonylcarbamoyltransferase complex ATPase subunit type 1 TsaE [Bdellovibrionota bacterium]